MNSKKLLAFLPFFLLVSMVNAQEDFSAVGLGNVELCPCSNQAYAITVENTGPVESSYNLIAGGEAAKWVAFNPESFVLAPEESGSFFVVVDSVCNTEGNFSLDVFIVTSNGLAKAVRQNLKISQCYDYTLSYGNVVDEDEEVEYIEQDGAYSLCTNEKKFIPILVTNNEDFENRYKIVMDAPEWASLTLEDVALSKKSSGVVLIGVNPPDIKGKFNFKLNAISDLGQVKRKSGFDVDVGACVSLEIQIEKEEDAVCGGGEKSYKVLIKNSGTLDQTVNFEIEGPEWAEIADDELDLEVSEDGISELIVIPPPDVSDHFEITVNAIIEDFKFSDAINLEVVEEQACRKANINTKSIVRNSYEEDFFPIAVTNEGIQKATYEASIDGPEWVSISPNFLELNPEQKGNLNAFVNPGEEIEEGIYEVLIELKSDGSIYSKSFDVRLKRESELKKAAVSFFRLYKYYFYLAVALIILILVFIKPILKRTRALSEKYERYSAKIERQQIKEQERRERELEGKRKKEERRAEKEIKIKPTKKNGRKLKDFWNDYRVWIYSLLGVAAVFLVLLGQYYKLYNLRFIKIYIRNLFVGYLYYILIGVAVVILVAVALFYWSYKKKKKVKNTKISSKKRFKMPLLLGFAILLFIVLIAALYFFELFFLIFDLFLLYVSYIVSGIVILIILIAAVQFYKPLQKFLRK